MKQTVIESGRAEFALKAVKKIVNEKKEQQKKEYKSYTRKFPSLVLSNGLAASIAFIREKGGSYDLVYANISDWLIENKYIPESTQLIDYVCSLDSDNYRVITNEVLALFEWLRRFASGLIEGEDE